MIEFVTVAHGEVYPNACMLCNATKGPLVDTHVEKFLGPQVEHLYLCRMCVTRAARVFGLVKGERMEQLLAADTELAAKEQELTALAGELAEARLEAGGQRASVRELQARLQEQQGRMKTMAHLATEVERQTREIVEVAAGPPVVDLVEVA